VTEVLDTSAMHRLRESHAHYAVVLMYESADNSWRSAVVPRNSLPEITRLYVDANREHVTAHAVREIVRLAGERNG
jgi:hypothetical protein